MEHNKAPRSDGFPADFYQTFCEVIKSDLMVMFAQLQSGKFPMYKINFGAITLLRKRKMRFKFNSIDLFVF
jgi:hypothetical protein